MLLISYFALLPPDAVFNEDEENLEIGPPVKWLLYHSLPSYKVTTKVSEDEGESSIMVWYCRNRSPISPSFSPPLSSLFRD